MIFCWRLWINGPFSIQTLFKVLVAASIIKIVWLINKIYCNISSLLNNLPNKIDNNHKKKNNHEVDDNVLLKINVDKLGNINTIKYKNNTSQI